MEEKGGERKGKVTCLTTLVTWKWPGCLEGLAPQLHAYVAKIEIEPFPPSDPPSFQNVVAPMFVPQFSAYHIVQGGVVLESAE